MRFYGRSTLIKMVFKISEILVTYGWDCIYENGQSLWFPYFLERSVDLRVSTAGLRLARLCKPLNHSARLPFNRLATSTSGWTYDYRFSRRRSSRLAPMNLEIRGYVADPLRFTVFAFHWPIWGGLSGPSVQRRVEAGPIDTRWKFAGNWSFRVSRTVFDGFSGQSILRLID